MPEKFEFVEIKPDGYSIREDSNGKTIRIPLFSRRTQYREHGQFLLKDLMQLHESDLEEGPSIKDPQ